MLLTAGESAEKVAEYLGQVTSQEMGLGVDVSRDLAVARLLVRWRSALEAGTAGRATGAKSGG